MRNFIILAAGIIFIFGLILFLMGQPLICECGYIKAWHGITLSSENSQHLSDWYSFSHIIHGIIFYGIYFLVARKIPLPLGIGFILALCIEVSWEIFENTDFVINRYREVTISLDYFGDSVINSVFDVLFMILGFFAARKLPVWATIGAVIFFEIFVAYFIRDNLALNIIMLIYPFEAILEWQRGI